MKKLLVCAMGLWLFNAVVLGQAPRKVDEVEKYNCEGLMARLDAFAVDIQYDRGKGFGYVVAYEGRYTRRLYNLKTGKSLGEKAFLPRFGEVNVRAEYIRDYLINRRGLEKRSLMLVNGGFREEHGVELWIVPRFGKLPKLSRTVAKIKYRRGIPKPYCEGL
ncbi:MAG: hypothetical protein HKN25_05875 [Pyrinomonadaceae bacterium]|nr:hypothetical protein [Pyrinomonadaceae bacterium]